MSNSSLASLLVILGVVVLGSLILAWMWLRSRRARRRTDAGPDLTSEIREQIIWRAMAQGGKITVADAATHGGRTPEDVERTLLMLVAEGQARAEADADGEIVYWVELASEQPGLSES